MGFFEDYFKGIQTDLKKAGIEKYYRDYINEAKRNSILIGIASSISLLLVSLIISILIKSKLIILPIVLGILGFIFGFFGTLNFYRVYPSLQASNRVKSLENSLYIVSLYMDALSSAGINPLQLFELLSKYQEFAEIRKESEYILKLVNGLGLPLNKALEMAANESPSRKWKELLLGINSILLEGGDLEKFLYEKSREYIEDFKRKIIEYSNNLQVFLEIYITMVILGIVFTIIITTLMGSIAATNPSYIESLQLLSVLVILPFGTAMFIILIKAINPIEE